MLRWTLLFDAIWLLTSPRVITEREREKTIFFPATEQLWPLNSSSLPAQSLDHENGLLLIRLGQADLSAGARGEFTLTHHQTATQREWMDSGAGQPVHSVSCFSLSFIQVLIQDCGCLWGTLLLPFTASQLPCAQRCARARMVTSTPVKEYTIVASYWGSKGTSSQPKESGRCQRRIMILLESTVGNKTVSHLETKKVTVSRQGQKSHTQREDTVVK